MSPFVLFPLAVIFVAAAVILRGVVHLQLAVARVDDSVVRLRRRQREMAVLLSGAPVADSHAEAAR